MPPVASTSRSTRASSRASSRTSAAPPSPTKLSTIAPPPIHPIALPSNSHILERKTPHNTESDSDSSVDQPATISATMRHLSGVFSSSKLSFHPSTKSSKLKKVALATSTNAQEDDSTLSAISALPSSDPARSSLSSLSSLPVTDESDHGSPSRLEESDIGGVQTVPQIDDSSTASTSGTAGRLGSETPSLGDTTSVATSSSQWSGRTTWSRRKVGAGPKKKVVSIGTRKAVQGSATVQKKQKVEKVQSVEVEPIVLEVMVHDDPLFRLTITHSSSPSPLRPHSITRTSTTLSFRFSVPRSPEGFLGIKLHSTTLDVPNEVGEPAVTDQEREVAKLWRLVVRKGEIRWEL